MKDRELRSQWRTIEPRIREHFGKLSEGDILEIRGQKDVFLAKLEERYGISRREALKEFNKFLGGLAVKA